MKKLIIIFIALMMLSGCQQKNNNEVSFHSGNWYEYFKDDEFAFKNVVAVPDKETALAVGEAIFKTLQYDGGFKNYVASSIFYDEEYELWIITFIDAAYVNADYSGGDLSIAIQKSDAKVVQIWPGE